MPFIIKPGMIFERKNKFWQKHYGRYVKITMVDYDYPKRLGWNSKLPLVMGVRSNNKNDFPKRAIGLNPRDEFNDEGFDLRRFKYVKG